MRHIIVLLTEGGGKAELPLASMGCTVGTVGESRDFNPLSASNTPCLPNPNIFFFQPPTAKCCDAKNA